MGWGNNVHSIAVLSRLKNEASQCTTVATAGKKYRGRPAARLPSPAVVFVCRVLGPPLKLPDLLFQPAVLSLDHWFSL